MIVTSLIITILYLFLIGSFVYGFDKVAVFNLEDLQAETKFSVIIPFRNEAGNLPDLLKSIVTLNYPKDKFEIIFIDDDSEDHSVETINKHLSKSKVHFTIIDNERHSPSPKKDAIATAINKAKSEWIITTDADCILPTFWLDSFDEFIQKNDTLCIAGAVKYVEGNSFLNRFQILDLLSLQGGTMGGFGLKKPFLCNGANFAYQKTLFKELNGFDGNTNIASGDDIFMLEKAVKTYPKKIHYLKCKHAIISTRAQASWKSLIQQRIRWAAKTSNYSNGFGKFTGLLVFIINATIILGLALSIFGEFNLKSWFYILIIKANIDFYLIYKSASFFDQKEALKSFVFGFILYPLFSVYVASISFFSSYEWKERTFKK
ncbi:glycosyltransferase family 2 protein [Flavisericum labens]|uniref:glycosyltransferase family 2 protein n=1 Tax=Flavisericum labens TaxID=3377112 RepID=UPI00387A9535